MDELTDRVVALEDVLGRAPELVERLRDAARLGERFALLDAALLRRVDAGPAPAPEVAWSSGGWRPPTAGRGRRARRRGRLEPPPPRRALAARRRDGAEGRGARPALPARAAAAAEGARSPTSPTTAASPTSPTSTASSARSPAARRARSQTFKTLARPGLACGPCPAIRPPLPRRPRGDRLARAAFGFETTDRPRQPRRHDRARRAAARRRRDHARQRRRRPRGPAARRPASRALVDLHRHDGRRRHPRRARAAGAEVVRAVRTGLRLARLPAPATPRAVDTRTYSLGTLHVPSALRPRRRARTRRRARRRRGGIRASSGSRRRSARPR